MLDSLLVNCEFLVTFDLGNCEQLLRDVNLLASDLCVGYVGASASHLGMNFVIVQCLPKTKPNPPKLNCSVSIRFCLTPISFHISVNRFFISRIHRTEVSV